ncbi:MAG: hypothetical protein RR458_01875 [Clostridia bacterium]
MAFFSKIVDVKKSEENFKERMKGGKIEKNDTWAMIFGAFLGLWPALLIIGGLALLMLFIFV